MQNLPMFNMVSFTFDQSAHTPEPIGFPTPLLFNADQITLVTGVLFQLVTDATVGDRWIIINYHIGALTRHRAISPTPITASQSAVVSFGLGMANAVIPTTNPQITAPLPNQLYLRENDYLDIRIIDPAVGDYIAIAYTTQLIWKLMR